MAAISAHPSLLFAHKLANLVFLFWHFAGITALVELPKNCVAAAMDKEIGKKRILMTRMLVAIHWSWKHNLFFFVVIYRLTVSTDSSLSMAEIRCLSDHQDQIRALINVNGPSARNHWITTENHMSPLWFISTPCLPQTGSSPVAPMQASWSCGMLLTGTSWPMSIFCGRSHKPVRRPKYDWPLPNPVRCPFSIWPPTERWRR